METVSKLIQHLCGDISRTESESITKTKRILDHQTERTPEKRFPSKIQESNSKYICVKIKDEVSEFKSLTNDLNTKFNSKVNLQDQEGTNCL